MIYLASPYSHPDVVVREERFRAACRTTARLIAAGHLVFSPIVQGHALVDHGLPTDWPFWESHGRWHLARCDAVGVLTLEGWRESVGVTAEIRIAKGLGKPIRYLSADVSVVSPAVSHVAEETRR